MTPPRRDVLKSVYLNRVDRHRHVHCISTDGSGLETLDGDAHSVAQIDLVLSDIEVIRAFWRGEELSFAPDSRGKPWLDFLHGVRRHGAPFIMFVLASDVPLEGSLAVFDRAYIGHWASRGEFETELTHALVDSEIVEHVGGPFDSADLGIGDSFVYVDVADRVWVFDLVPRTY